MAKATIPPELERAYDQGRRALLAQEARLRASLAATTRAALGGSPAASEHALRVAVAASVHRGRQDARDAGRESYVTEASVLDLPAPPDTHREQYDQDRAYAIGWSYGTFWRQQYARLGDGQKALDATEARLRMIGATEASEAMTDERDNIIRKVGEAQSKTGSLILFKVWDATLDRRTCSVCEREDGTVVPFFMSFHLGRPGSVHGNCRCYEGTILLPFWFSRESEIAA